MLEDAPRFQESRRSRFRPLLEGLLSGGASVNQALMQGDRRAPLRWVDDLKTMSRFAPVTERHRCPVTEVDRCAMERRIGCTRSTDTLPIGYFVPPPTRRSRQVGPLDCQGPTAAVMSAAIEGR